MRRLSAKRQAAIEAAERLNDAQLICFEAMEASTAKRRVALAKKALALSAHCADAYTILADHAASGEERLGFRRNAVAAGEEALGKDFDEIVGAFWMVLETRPFMRAKANLASELWERGEKAAAIDEAQDMLRLNPNDNQGMRDYLAAWLAEAGRYDELERLLQDYREDSSAAWAWTRALLAYRKAGDGAGAREFLSKPIETIPMSRRSFSDALKCPSDGRLSTVREKKARRSFMFWISPAAGERRRALSNGLAPFCRTRRRKLSPAAA